MSVTLAPFYRSTTHDGRTVTGLDGAEISDTREGGARFYLTPRGASSMIPQVHTPRRVRMLAGTVEHTSNRWHGPQFFRVIERLRADSMGARPTIYGWRACGAVEVVQ